MSRVEDNKENEEICRQYCGTCPTYPGVKGELLLQESEYCGQRPQMKRIMKTGEAETMRNKHCGCEPVVVYFAQGARAVKCLKRKTDVTVRAAKSRQSTGAVRHTVVLTEFVSKETGKNKLRKYVIIFSAFVLSVFSACQQADEDRQEKENVIVEGN